MSLSFLAFSFCDIVPTWQAKKHVGKSLTLMHKAIKVITTPSSNILRFLITSAINRLFAFSCWQTLFLLTTTHSF